MMSTQFDQPILDAVRIDKWLWAVRICKTRKDAMDLCKRQRVLVEGQVVKPSREVRPGQTVVLKRDGVDWTYEILQCIEKRVGAKLAVLCKNDVTPEDQLEKRALAKASWVPRRPKGMGRPTKKDRRDMDRVIGKG